MTEKQAQDAVLAVEQTWVFTFGVAAKKLWTAALLPYDSITTAAATMRLHDKSRERPTIAELKAQIEEIDAQMAGEQTTRTTTVARTDDDVEEMTREQYAKEPKPDWPHVWFWMRFKQNDFRLLPQQDPLGHAPNVLNPDQYAEVHGKWVADGSPKVTSEILAAGLAGALPAALPV